MESRKEFLLRKNKGRLVLNNYLDILKQAGLDAKNVNFLTLEESDILFEKAKIISHNESRRVFDAKNERQNFQAYIDKVLLENNDIGIAYLWTDYSQYCGLLEVEFGRINGEFIINILNNEYCGGYCTLFSEDIKLTFDLDEDYDENKKYGWLYSVCVFK